MGFEQHNLDMEEGTLEVGMGESMIRISCYLLWHFLFYGGQTKHNGKTMIVVVFIQINPGATVF